MELVLLPGLLNDAGLWRHQVAGLAGLARCQVGDITRRDTIRAAAEDVLAAAPAAFALAGFSLGGFVAQEVLRLAPGRVTRLALLGTSMRGDTAERAAGRRALDALVRRPGRFHGFGEGLMARFVAPARAGDAALLAEVRAMTARLGAEVFLRQNAMARRDGAEVLRAVRCPALVLCGALDRITPVEEHRAMAAAIPGARLVIVPESGHLVPLEQPEAVTAALAGWLTG